MKRLTLVWITSLALVAVATFAFAQNRFPLSQQQILSGNDIGFRVEGTGIDGKPTGTWLVRFNGAWVEVGSWAGVRPATK